MNNRILRALFCALAGLGFLVCFSRPVMAADAATGVIPEPQQVTRLPGAWTASDRTVIVLGEKATADDRFAAGQLAAEIRLAGGPQVAVAAAGLPGAGPKIRMCVPSRDGLSMPLPPEIGEQGYVLEAKDGELLLAANTALGLFYAVQTAGQLLRKTEAGVGMPALRVVDWPDMKHRMIQYDFARSQQANVAYVKRMIDVLSRYKLNELMFYMEDDYRFAKYPFLGRPGTWTRPMIEELVAYARPRHVQLVPQIQSMGHAAGLLSHDELAYLRENVDEYAGPKPYTSYCSGFCPTAPGIEKFWNDIYGELAEVFSNSEFIHAGLDEAHQFGFCNRCQAFQKEHGNAGLLAQYVDMLNRTIRRHGKTMMYWEPFGGLGVSYPDWMKRRPKNDFQDQAIGFDYEYGNWSRWRIGLLQKAGFHRLFVSPGVIGWGCIYPDYGVATKNIREFILAGLKANAEGVCTTTWEMGAGNFFEQTWYGHVYTAQCAWSSKMTDLEVLDRNFGSSFFGLTSEDRGQAICRMVRAYTERPFNEQFWGTAGENGCTYTFCTTLFWRSMGELTMPFQPAYFSGKMRPFPEAKEAEGLLQRTEETLQTIQRIRPSVKRNQITLDFIELAARSYRHVARKIIVRERCAGLYREAKRRLPADRAAAVAGLRQIADELGTLADDYPYFTAMYTRGMNECGAPANSGNIFQGVRATLDRQIATIRTAAETLAKEPQARMPAAVQLGLGPGGPWDKLGQWTPETTPKSVGQLQFDATPCITASGAYLVRLLYQSGRHGVNTCGVALLADGQEVAQDRHRGWSGASQSNHIYLLEVPKTSGVKKWTLVVTLESNNLTDSTGDVAILRESE